jgi:multidrug efflux pump subunit AcrA (membrane-fusion protein)
LSENQVIVFTDWSGRSPQEVEDQITYPLTTNWQGRFQKRDVQVGEAAGEWVRILSGVSSGERVVTEGSFFVRAEWERSGQSHRH